MTEQSRPARQLEKHYIGKDTDIRYSIRRCIHAEECVRRLPTVFDPAKRPWIAPDAATAEEVLRVVTLCPSGALHVAAGEVIPAENTVRLWENRPLQFTGNMHIAGATLEIDETRATLCRCGASKNKPFCDNTHRATQFVAAHDAPPTTSSTARGGSLTITPEANGPLQVLGNVEVINVAGETIFSGTETYLCRCGASNNKPFCDGSHERIGFQAE